MFCPKCGTQINAGAAFCPSCGEKIVMPQGFGTASTPVPPSQAQQSANVATSPSEPQADAAASAPEQPANPSWGQPANPTWEQPASPSWGQPASPSWGQPNASSAWDQPSRAGSMSASWLDPARIIALVCTVLMIVFMFLDWLSVPIMQNAKSLVSELGSTVGVSLGSSNDYNYPMYDMSEVTDTLDALVSLGNSSSYTNTYSYTGVTNPEYSSLASSPFGATHAGFLVFWVIALLLVLAGAIVLLASRKHGTGLLLAGSIVAALMAISWCIAISGLNTVFMEEMASEIGYRTTFFAVTFAPVAVAVIGVVTAICCGVSKKIRF